jgi:hypothetical protein
MRIAAGKPYDFYADMLQTHSEIGYLLVVLVALLLYNAVVGIAICRFPVDDVYLVPGVEACGVAHIAWDANAPTLIEPSAIQSTPVRADLGAVDFAQDGGEAEGEAAAHDAAPAAGQVK